MLDHSCQVQRHKLSERGDDLYETPEVATKALLCVEPLQKVIWEPAAGRGRMVNVLTDAGHYVFAGDLIDYNIPGQVSGVDFLLEQVAPSTCIVTNPPYKLAEEFVKHALELCPKVVMLLRLAFLESERRSSILDNGWLARVYVFRKRLPMMHRDGWEGKKANSGMAFAWFVWDKHHTGPTTIRRISWEDNRDAKTS